MALFVGANDALKKRVQDILPDQTRVEFVSCPDVIHAAMMQILRENLNEYENEITTTFKPENKQKKEEFKDNLNNEIVKFPSTITENFHLTSNNSLVE